MTITSNQLGDTLLKIRHEIKVDKATVERLIMELYIDSLTDVERLSLRLLYKVKERGVSSKEAARELYANYTTVHKIFAKFKKHGLATSIIDKNERNKRSTHMRWYPSLFLIEYLDLGDVDGEL